MVNERDVCRDNANEKVLRQRKCGEEQYLELVRRVLAHGRRKRNRTGVEAVGCFGAQIRFDLRDDAFPLFSCRRVFWRGIVEELLWFVRGSTDARELSDRGVKIWNANASRVALDELGFTLRREGQLGPTYGFQWRRFGAPYVDGHDDDSGTKKNCNFDAGVDQLRYVVETIRRDPTSRRILLTSWNPVDVPKCALPPCHVLVQFFVDDETRELSAHVYQRSADLALGVPFNVASYALLTRMIASVTSLRARELVFSLGDYHVYDTHVAEMMELIERPVKPCPLLRFSRVFECNASTDDALRTLESFAFEDFELMDYDPHSPVKMEMVI